MSQSDALPEIPQSPTKVLVIDDHELIQMATEQLIEIQQDLRCVGACTDLESAKAVLSENEVDVVICDLLFEMGNSLAFVAECVANYPAKVLVSSAHRAEVYAGLCASAGASGFIHKSAPAAELLEAVRTLARRDSSTGFVGQLGDVDENSPAHRLGSLTAREWEVLTQIGKGFATKEIAKSLFLSAKTVESHRASLKRKLDIDSKDMLASYAAELCLAGT